jgi:hypothetical protein
MNDSSELKQRIEQAATGLDAAENMRRDRNSTLGETLAKVEERFNARRLELGYLRERIGELESANQGLTNTIETFSVMIQDESEGEIESALFRASAGARELLAQIESGALSRRQSPLAAFDRHLEQPMRFEDVTQAELDAEDTPDLSPSAPVAARMDDGIDIPEMTENVDAPDPASASIHDLLERLARHTAAQP